MEWISNSQWTPEDRTLSQLSHAELLRLNQQQADRHKQLFDHPYRAQFNRLDFIPSEVTLAQARQIVAVKVKETNGQRNPGDHIPTVTHDDADPRGGPGSGR